MCDPVIDEPDEVVVVTGGSGRMLNPGFHRAAVDGLVKAGRRGIVVTPHPDLIGSMSDGIVHRSALPFDAFVPTVAGVVHHGGIGTVARALRSGVPQLVLADSADRPDNGARLENLGLARSLGPEDWDADTIAAEIQQFGSASRRQVAARSVRLTIGPDAVETAVDQICSLT